jgi:hypothetical protein
MDIDADLVASGAGGASPPAATAMGRGRRLKKPAAIVSDDEMGPSGYSNEEAMPAVTEARKVPRNKTVDASPEGGNSEHNSSASDEDAGFTRRRQRRGGKVLRRAKADKAGAAAPEVDAASDAGSGSDAGSDGHEDGAAPPAKRSRGRSASAAATGAPKARRQAAQSGRGRGRGRGGAAKRSAGGRGADADSDGSDDGGAAGADSGGEGAEGREEDVLATQAFVAASLDPRLKELVDAGSGKRATYHVYAQALTTTQQQQALTAAGAAAAGDSAAAGGERVGTTSDAGQAAAALVYNAYLVSRLWLLLLDGARTACLAFKAHVFPWRRRKSAAGRRGATSAASSDSVRAATPEDRQRVLLTRSLAGLAPMRLCIKPDPCSPPPCALCHRPFLPLSPLAAPQRRVRGGARQVPPPAGALLGCCGCSRGRGDRGDRGSREST